MFKRMDLGINIPTMFKKILKGLSIAKRIILGQGTKKPPYYV